MKRRSRLSRSRDFDAVYRHGRSSSTRYLTLYSFPRPDAGPLDDSRFGLAISRQIGGAVARNRLKRQLREALEKISEPQGGHDYVLIARQGLAEAADSRGQDWLVGRIEEAFTAAASPSEEMVT